MVEGVRNGSFGAERRVFSIDIVLFYPLVVLGLEDLVYCEGMVWTCGVS